MYVDAQLLFSDAQAVTAAAASTNIVDLGVARDLGTGQDLYVVVSVDTTMDDDGDDSTLEVKVQKDTVEGFGSAEDAQIIGTFAATSAAGTRLVAKLDPDKIDQRYIRLYYTPANGNLSAGAFTAFITTDVQAYTSYAAGYTISG